MLDFLYCTVCGRLILKILTRPFLSVLAGHFMDSVLSVPLIKPFIRRNSISLEDYESEKWTSFNHFFTRRTKKGKRVFDPDPKHLTAPCDGLLTVYRISSDLRFTVKHSIYSIESLLENHSLAEDFKDGLCLVFRLTPSHYHRFHYMDNGQKGENISIKGILHTVQPIAVENVPVYTRNSREYCVLHTENFGDTVVMEVGALFVGRIVNLHGAYTFSRGEEKGRFEFGGSTVIVLLKPGAAEISEGIINANLNGLEYPVTAGEKIGQSIS